MKFKNYLLPVLMLFAGIFTACEQVDEITPTIRIEQNGKEVVSLEIPAAAAEVELNVVANVSWNIGTKADWIAIAPASFTNGTGKDATTAVKLTVLENTAKESRTAVIDAAVQGVKVTLNLTQSGADEKPGKTTIAEVLAAEPGQHALEGVTVAALNARSVLLTDGEDYILAYAGSTPVYGDEAKTAVKVGDKLNITGTTSLYGGMIQFGSGIAMTFAETDADFKQPEAKTMVAADFEAFAGKPVVEYVTYTGKLVIEGYYYNVVVAGLEGIQGAISYPVEDTVPSAWNGAEVTVTGYTTGYTSNKDNTMNFVQTMAVKVEKQGGDVNYEEVTIDEITEQGNYTVKNACVVGLYARGFIVADNTMSAILIYTGNADYSVEMYDVVNLKGTVSVYNTMLQFTADTEIEKIGNQIVDIPYAEFTATELDEYVSGYYAGIMTGLFSVSHSADGTKTYYNLAVGSYGTTVSISFPLAKFEIEKFDGKTVTVKGFSLNKSNNFLNVLINEIVEVEEPPVDQVTPIAEVVKGNTYLMEGTVTALSSNGFILTDATASIFCYRYTDVKIGDKIKIEAPVSAYNRGLQLSGDAAKVEVEDNKAFEYPAPAVADAAALDAFVADPSDRFATYVTLTGDLTINDKFYNIAVDGTTVQGSLYNATDEIKALLTTGTNITVEGYAMSVSGKDDSQYYNIVATKATVNEPEVPDFTITVNPESIDWEADAKDVQNINVNVASAEGLAILDWDCTLAGGEDDWFKIVNVNPIMGYIMVAPKAVNDTETEQSSTLTVTKGNASATIALNHKKSVVSSELTVAELRTMAMAGDDLTTYNVKGTVIYLGNNSVTSGISYGNVVLSDNNGTVGSGINFYNTAADALIKNTTLKVGDEVIISLANSKSPAPGTYGLQINGTLSTDLVSVVSSGNELVKTTITGDRLADYQAQYVSIENAKAPATAVGNKFVGTLTFNDGNDITVYTKAGWAGADVVIGGQTATISGIVGYYKSCQLCPVELSDVEAFATRDAITATPAEWEWEADATASKEFTIEASDATWSMNVPENATWLTASVADNVLTVTPTANTTPLVREAKITLTCGSASTAIVVKQKSNFETLSAVFDFTQIGEATATVGDISFATIKATGSSAPLNKTDHIRIYTNNTATFTAAEGHSILKIDLDLMSGYTAEAKSDTGAYTVSAADLTGTWLGESGAVVLTPSAQMRVKKITVTYFKAIAAE